MRQFLIDENLLGAVIGYLETRPYKEVAPAVRALLILPQHVATDIDTSRNETAENGDGNASVIMNGI